MMLYCSNPLCSDPFNIDGAASCSRCGHQSLAPIFHHRYKVLKILGEGGFGRTYQALDIDQMNHPCVIKQLTFSKPQALDKVRDLFQQEAKRLYELGEHRQIPSFLAYFEENNQLYLVQEYIEGKNLYAEFQEEGKFDEGKIRKLLTNFLPVLQFIHEHKIIHRDIKPENIMRCDTDDRLVLIDFGIAKELASTIGHTQGTVIGTPGYAPAEQIVHGRVCPGTDLYSLGITCIRLITGQFTGNDLNDLAYSEKKWWEVFQVDFNSQLLKILDKLIEVEPSKRYRSAQEVLEDLERLNQVSESVAVTGEYTRKIINSNDQREVSGIILGEPDHRELVRIAKASIVRVEERWQGKKRSNGVAFLYKQVIVPETKRSRCYFLTDNKMITGVFECHKYLSKIAKSGKNIENIKLQFVALWNQKEYSIDEFLIPASILSSDPRLDVALFHLDIDTIEILDFFGIAFEGDLSPGDKLHSFDYGDGFSTGDGDSAGLVVNASGAMVGISTRDDCASFAGRSNFFIDIYSLLEKLNNSDNWRVFSVTEYLRAVKEKIKESDELLSRL